MNFKPKPSLRLERFIPWITMPLLALFAAFLMSLDKPKRADPDKAINQQVFTPTIYFSKKANGTVQSMHIGGNTEVTPIVQVKLTHHNENTWLLNGVIIQPKDKNNYWVPILTGTIDARSYFGSAQLFETAKFSDNPVAKSWNEFRVANIIFNNEKPVSLLFKHYSYKDEQWKEIAGYEATFEE